MAQQETKTRQIHGYTFGFIATIDPDRDGDGQVREDQPQSRYKNRKGLPLNRHGAGAFCRFRIPKGLDFAGVYALTVDDDIAYVGKCQRLTERFNMGYGNISPRNCFKGGQSTNCKVNKLILQEVKADREVELWFHRVPEPGVIEADLIRRLQPQWNSQLLSRGS
jgi:hypothetical protein